MPSEVGLIGLKVMGQNLALNLAGRGWTVAVYNRTTDTTRRFVQERAQGLPVTPAATLEEFVGLLTKPRIVLLLVQAGPPVDELLGRLAALLSPGDLVLDCGNSHFQDTERRARELKSRGVELMGVGVSGGEEGALHGPSIMPGGSAAAYARVRTLLESIAAKTADGPCVSYIGPAGAGHYVKMIHNGLEYGDMQLLAESYHLLAQVGGFTADELSRVFSGFNQGETASYLLEITARVLAERDPETGRPLVEVILDRAGQKGTGRWSAENALALGEPTPTITAAVEARLLSAQKELRLQVERIFPRSGLSIAPAPIPPARLAAEVGDALFASRLSLYAQGMALLQAASREYRYDLNLAELARIWKGGCIIRSALLDLLRGVYQEQPDLPHLFLHPAADGVLKPRYENWVRVCQTALAFGVPCPAFTSALNYFETLRSGRLPANLIQAQRDFFGAHTFERVDHPGTFHHSWNTGDSSG